MIVRDATEDDLVSIVFVHKNAFQGFFLTMLGEGFLVELYRAFAFRESGILRVICDDTGLVVGFAAGTTNPDVFYSKLKAECGFVFLLKMLPAMFRMPRLVFKKIWYAISYKGEKPKSLVDSGFLSSIAVNREFSGLNFGKMLLLDFEDQLLIKAISSVYLTTDKFNNSGVVQFYNRNGYSVESEFIQADGRCMLRLLKYLNGL